MKKTLAICVLLLLGVGCGRSEQAAKQATGENEQTEEQPSKEQQLHAIAALPSLLPVQVPWTGKPKWQGVAVKSMVSHFFAAAKYLM
jgi:hypothetical protein